MILILLRATLNCKRLKERTRKGVMNKKLIVVCVAFLNMVDTFACGWLCRKKQKAPEAPVVSGDVELGGEGKSGGNSIFSDPNHFNISDLAIVLQWDNHEQLARFLNVGGLRVNARARDCERQKPLVFFVFQYDAKKCFQLLVERRVDLNARELKSGNSLLSSVLFHIEWVRLILAAKPNVDAQNNFGSAAVHEAVMTNRLEAFDELVKACANVHLKTNAGSTLLHLIAYALVDQGPQRPRAIRDEQTLNAWVERLKRLRLNPLNTDGQGFTAAATAEIFIGQNETNDAERALLQRFIAMLRTW